MKLTTLVTVIALTLVAGSTFAKAHGPVSVLAVRNDLFYFKVDRELIGSVVEVYTSSGELVSRQTMTHRRMLIDFYDKNDGEYTIKIRSKSTEVDYLYTKVDPAGIDEFTPTFRRI